MGEGGLQRRPIRYLWAIVTWDGKHLQETLDSIPAKEERVVIDSKAHGWSVAEAWNHALKKYVKKYDAIIICNDDIRVKEDTAAALTGGLLRLGPQFNCLMTTAYDRDRQGGNGKLVWVDAKLILPGMFCFCVTRQLVDEIGYFDERFKPALFEDTDMLYRIYRAGKTVKVVAPVFHHGSGTLESFDRKALFETGYGKYVEKWGGEPGRETEALPAMMVKNG